MINQLHYSAKHWEKQRADIDRYIDRLNYIADRVSGRYWNPWLHETEPVNPGLQGTTFDRLKKLERIKELRASAGDRLKYAHVNAFTMANDPLRANGVSWGVMLDDLKKDLYTRINDRFENDRIETEKNDRQAKFTRVLLCSIQDAARFMRYGVRDKVGPGQPITLLGQAVAKTSQAFKEYHNVMSPIKVKQDIIADSSLNLNIGQYASVLEKGREILDYKGAIAERSREKKYYAAYRLTSNKSIRGKRVPDFIACSYEYEFKSVVLRNTYFVCSLFHWKQYSEKPLPKIGETTISKSGHTWIRTR
jgi:hypothetical protein